MNQTTDHLSILMNAFEPFAYKDRDYTINVKLSFVKKMLMSSAFAGHSFQVCLLK